MDVPPGPAALMGSFYVWAPDIHALGVEDAGRHRPGRRPVGSSAWRRKLRPAIQALIANPAVNPMMDPANEPLNPWRRSHPVSAGRCDPCTGSTTGWCGADGEAIAAAAPETATLRRLPGSATP